MTIAEDRIYPDIVDPDQYVVGPPHEIFEYLRCEHPVFRQAMPDGTAYWAVSGTPMWSDVARRPVFSASEGGVVLEDCRKTWPGCATCSWPWTRPATDYRRAARPSSRPRSSTGSSRSASICRAIMADASERGEVEFVHDVTSHCRPRSSAS